MGHFSLHHNETIFPDSFSFIPERWLPDPITGTPVRVASATGPNGTGVVEGKPLRNYLGSFSKGSRQCLGMHLAYAEMYIILASVIRRNDFVLFDTGRESVSAEREFLLARPGEGVEGVRVRVL